MQKWSDLSPEEMKKRRAPAGMIWQCGACGKRAEDQYGIIGWHSYGYDESCMLNCTLVKDSTQKATP